MKIRFTGQMRAALRRSDAITIAKMARIISTSSDEKSVTDATHIMMATVAPYGVSNLAALAAEGEAHLAALQHQPDFDNSEED